MALSFSDDKRKTAEKLYRAFWHDALRTAQKILKDRSLSEDIAQQAFMKLFDNLDKVPCEPCQKTRRYLLVIVRNLAIDEYNRKKKLIEPVDDLSDVTDQLADPSDLEETVIRNCTAQMVAEAMKKLPARDADILALVYGYEHTVRECGEILDIGEEAAKKALQRARKKLRKELKV